MRVSILLRPILDTLSIHNDRGDGNNNNEVEHMRAIEVQPEEVILQVCEEAVLRLSRVALQLFDRIGHCAQL